MWEWVSCHSNSCHTGSCGNDGTMVVTLVVWTGPSVHGAGDVEGGGGGSGHTVGHDGVLYVCIAASLGTVPDQCALKEAPTFPENADPEGAVAKMALQTSSLLALLNAQDLPGVSAKATKVWLGEGLGTVSKRTHDRMMKWEFIDLGELRTRTLAERGAVESDTERLVVLPGFELSQAKKKPIADILMWVQCFSRYTAAMAKKFPESTPGFTSHMLVVLKAHAEVVSYTFSMTAAMAPFRELLQPSR